MNSSVSRMSDRLRISIADSIQDMEEVYRLTYLNYLRRGMCCPHPSQKIIHQPERDLARRTTVLLACDGPMAVGTLSISFAGRVEELYNFHLFEEHLTQEQAETNGARLFSGWRLATRDAGAMGKVVALQLMLKAMEIVMQEEVYWGYLCFQKQDLSFYERVSPGGKIIGLARKKTDMVDAELLMWRCHLSAEDYASTFRLAERLSRRFIQ